MIMMTKRENVRSVRVALESLRGQVDQIAEAQRPLDLSALTGIERTTYAMLQQRADGDVRRLNDGELETLVLIMRRADGDQTDAFALRYLNDRGEIFDAQTYAPDH